MTKVRSRDRLTNLYDDFCKVYIQYTWQAAGFRENIKHANAKVATKFLFINALSNHAS